ncbi:MAG TPA: cysteine hydrolase [Thermoplasmatales archaeon]|nr:cysteine hydrolase [Thermoplasmatales archaeon]
MQTKETYYTLKNIDQQAEKLLQKTKPYIKKNNVVFKPEKSALLVMDMQKYFLDEQSHAFIPSAKAITPRIKKLQNTYLKKRLPVVQTRHLNTKNNAKSMNRWWNGIITKDNHLSQITEELLSEKIPVINKTQYDAFFKTDLNKRLKNNNVQQVVVTGVMTHLCCETTARSAFMRGFDVFFVVDGTATYNKTFHLSTLINLAHGFAIPITTKEVIQKTMES